MIQSPSVAPRQMLWPLVSLLLLALLVSVSGCTKCGGSSAPEAFTGADSEAPTFAALFSTMPDDGKALELSAAQKAVFRGYWVIDAERTLEGLSGEMLDHMTEILSYSKIGFVFDGEGALSVRDASDEEPETVDVTYSVAHIKGDGFVLAVNADDIPELGMDYLLVHFAGNDVLRFSPIVGPSFFGDEPMFVLTRTTKEALDAAMSGIVAE